jgi:hypothetical protein
MRREVEDGDMGKGQGGHGCFLLERGPPARIMIMSGRDARGPEDD